MCVTIYISLVTKPCGNSKIFLSLILREINFEESRISKTAVSAILGGLNLVNFVNLSLKKVQKVMKMKIQSLSIC